MEQISVERLHERLQSGENIHVLDVREEGEFEEDNIGARFWPLSRLRQMDANGLEEWKDDDIIVHCHSGKRSMEACMLLETMGFSKTVNLKGGIKEWRERYGNEQLA